jgi:Ca2+-binding RTX toxin-like protein
VVLLATAIAALAWAPAAFAAPTVSFSGTTTTVVDDASSTSLTLDFQPLGCNSGTVDCDRFSSLDGGMTASAPCGGGDTVVYCPVADNYAIDLGGGNDYFAVNGAFHTYTSLVVHGGDGVDRIFGGPGNDQIYGDAGDDHALNGEGGNDLIDGGPGDDQYLQCQDESRTQQVDPGADTYVGGTGNDRLCYSDRTAGVNVSLDGVANDGQPGENDNVGGDIEEIDGTGSNDTLIGNELPNILNGGGGDDTIDGGGGNDTLYGSSGNDTVTGGAGQDTIYGDSMLCGGTCDVGDDTIYARDGEIDNVICGAGTDSVTADASDAVSRDPIVGCENVYLPPPPPPPPPPPTVHCVVPKVKGKLLGAAELAIRRGHCRVGRITRAYSAKVKKNHVISQTPAAGRSLAQNGKVSLLVSKGRKPKRR